MIHYQEWGTGAPVIALHPLALESTAFAGMARALEARGFRTLAADLPGFGQTPAPDLPLTPAVLAEPVIELARSLETPPIVMGMSLGGRVALEAALLRPRAFAGVVPVAPYLPWRHWRWAMPMAGWLDPAWGERLPLERIWPALQLAAEWIERQPRFENDWFARACVRVIYYSSCPATRTSFLSAAREMALEPAFGEQGFWTRLPRLSLPATFVWAGRDGLIPSDHQPSVAEVLPRAGRVEIPCSGHFVNGEHFRCLEQAVANAVEGVRASRGRRRRAPRVLAPCWADAPAEAPAAPWPPEREPRAAKSGGD